MKLFKKHKKKILLLIIAIFLIIILVLLKDVLLSNGKSAYGDRLEGISKVKIATSLKDDVVNTLENKANVDKASIDIKGKIISILLTVDKNATSDVMKTYATDILAKFKETEIAFYDFQFFITQDNDTDAGGFRLIGYKNVKSSIIVWSSNE